jgi:hypothetical protein
MARKAVQDILPMSLDTLKESTWDMVCFAVPSSQSELVWKSVRARHRQFQLRQPLCEANMYLSWVKMLDSVHGLPLALKLPIQKPRCGGCWHGDLRRWRRIVSAC